MEKIYNWITKKRAIVIGIFSTLAASILFQMNVRVFLYDSFVTRDVKWREICIDSINFFDLILLLGAVILIPTLIMFYLKNEVFESWKKTLINYIYIYIAILIFVPWHGGDAYLHIEKDLVAILASVIYVIFSVFYILIKNYQLKSR